MRSWGTPRSGIVLTILIAAAVSMPIGALAKGPPGPKGLSGGLCGYFYDATSGEGIDQGSIWVLGIVNKQGEPVIGMTAFGGYYEFLQVPVGEYTLMASANSYEIVYEYDVKIIRGEWTQVDFVLRRTGDITGFVMDSATGDPIPGAYVYLLEGNEYNDFYTSESGGFTLSMILPGTYTLIIEAEGHPQYIYPEPLEVIAWKFIPLYWIYIP
jgi:hypothetical protein